MSNRRMVITVEQLSEHTFGLGINHNLPDECIATPHNTFDVICSELKKLAEAICKKHSRVAAMPAPERVQ